MNTEQDIKGDIVKLEDDSLDKTVEELISNVEIVEASATHQ